MSQRRKAAVTGAMLELWRPPEGAGEPVGCLATTYTFAPGLFDEQCLARFLEIESEPNREDLAFLLERESRLDSGVYAGVLVDHTQAGVEHSYRWDVLPVRIRGGKQHAKLSLLVWAAHIRVIVSSANLTDQGYRTNREVAGAFDVSANGGSIDGLRESLSFLRNLLRLVPGAATRPPTVLRADEFLATTEDQIKKWTPVRRRTSIKQHVVFTLPGGGGTAARSALEDAVALCRRGSGSPSAARVASPFFDGDGSAGEVTKALCKALARSEKRSVEFCVMAIGEDKTKTPRLAAPRTLIDVPVKYGTEVTVLTLPFRDPDGNLRPWHAKMLGLSGDAYTAVMIGSSNFTVAGMGTGARRNAEANLLTFVEYVEFARDTTRLDSVWPELTPVQAPESAEWRGAIPETDEEEQASQRPAPPGFLVAIYHAGDHREIVLVLEPTELPHEWQIYTAGRDSQLLLSSEGWAEHGGLKRAEIPWQAAQPPEKLVVRWESSEAFLPLNVDDARKLPPPTHLEHMSADDMLGILAAADPGAAYRQWAKENESTDIFDTDLDSAVPVDLDPLRRYDLQVTFLHRVRRRARVLAQLRANLQRPVRGRQALEWRLRGLVGIAPLADRLVKELAVANGKADEALLSLADFLLVLREVDYQPGDDGLSKKEFTGIFRAFLTELVEKLETKVTAHRGKLSDEPTQFWRRVVERCRA
jgi:hypothetical protein